MKSADAVCTNCGESVTIEDGIFECQSCDLMGVLELPTPMYNITVKMKDTSQKNLSMPTELLEDNNITKKQLFSSQWAITIKDNTVLKIKKN